MFFFSLFSLLSLPRYNLKNVIKQLSKDTVTQNRKKPDLQQQNGVLMVCSALSHSSLSEKSDPSAYISPSMVPPS